ncbi:MAG: redox-sensing transcriptional repressor Rex [Phycisphaerales bacterium]|nr:redox-sensing transcriptional repressor Rex [Phycisphaerales bacterium]
MIVEARLMVSPRMLERLSAYRRLLAKWIAEKRERIYSHELGALAGATPAQVRRDVMTIGFTGSPARGYDATGLLQRIGELLDPQEPVRVALLGVGFLGRAVLDYFSGRSPNYAIVAAFDVSSEKVGRVIHGVRCYHIEELDEQAREQAIDLGVIAVPAPVAQSVAERACRAGLRGLLNFAPAKLHVPPEVHVENVDLAVSLEKVAFFARHGSRRREVQS